MAGFALTAGLTTLVFLIVLQFAFFLHTKAVLIDAAGQGARVAARHGGTLEQGIARTNDILSPLTTTPTVTAHHQTLGQRPAVRITVTTQFPILGPYGLPGFLHAQGNALVETYEPLE